MFIQNILTFLIYNNYSNQIGYGNHIIDEEEGFHVTFKSSKEFEEQLVTPCFQTVFVPYLEGTPAQIKWAKDIRKKYIQTLQRKLSDIPMFERQQRVELVQKFNTYVNAKPTKQSKHWIENHCRLCGSILAKNSAGQTMCTNDVCGDIRHG